MLEEKEENTVVTIAIVEEINKGVISLNPERIKSYETHSPELKYVILGISENFRALYDSVEKIYHRELLPFHKRISSIKHSPTNTFLDDLSELSENRRELKDALNSCASKLDKGFLLTNAGRLFVSLLELVNNIDSAFDKKISECLIKKAYDYWCYFGFTLHIIFGCISVSGYLGFIPEIWNQMYSKWVLRDLVKVTQNDDTLLERVRQWFSKTEEMEEEVKELFSSGLNYNFLKEVEMIYKDYDSSTQIFAAIFISCIRVNNSISKDITFLIKMFMFSKSEVAEEWYNRALKMNHPTTLIRKKLDSEDKLIGLAEKMPEISIDFVKILPEVKLKPDIEKKLKFKLQLKPTIFLMFGIMNMFSIYSSGSRLLYGEKHVYSTTLRKLSQKALESLIEMDTFLTKSHYRKRSIVD